MHCFLLAAAAAAFELNYQSIAVTAPRRVVSAADVDARVGQLELDADSPRAPLEARLAAHRRE